MRWGLLLVALAGCSNMQDVVREKDRGGGVGRVYPVSEDQAWRISETILRLSEIPRIQDHRSEGYLLAVVDAGPLSSGTYLGVWLEAASPSETKVTFVRRRKVATQTLRTLTEETFHRQFEALVDLSSKSCPPASPAPSGTTSSAPASPAPSTGAP
jgi:hypothetical protein